MPLIEELPVTAPMRVSHGWAYVPDTGPIPAMAPPGARKRGRQDAGTTNATATAKLQKSIQQRLESLDRENYRDGVVVPIPTRSKSGAGEVGGSKMVGKKMSNNVRRILTYQRTFQHYLADEEAGVGGGGGSVATSAGASAAQGASQSASARNEGRRKSGAVSVAAAPPAPVTDATSKSTSKRGSRRRESEVTVAATPSVAAAASSKDTPTPRRRGPGRPSRSSAIKQEEDTAMTGTEAPTAAHDQDIPSTSDHQQSSIAPSQDPPSLPNSTTRSLYDPKLDSHPLLRTLDLPKQPSARILSILLSEPPLSYTAARAPASGSALEDGNREKNPVIAKPQRHFCALCGYWGKIKCRKCGEWTCGLMECWKGHEGVCIAMGMY